MSATTATKRELRHLQTLARNPDHMPQVTLDKAHSSLKVLDHEELLRKFVAGEEIRPIHLRIGIMGGCNMRCNFCNFHSPNEKSFYDLFSYKDLITTEQAIELLGAFAKADGRAVTLCGSGENTTHPGYVAICRAAFEVGLRIGLITNGSRLHREDIRECVADTHAWVRIGMNAGTADTFAAVTHSPLDTFDAVLGSIRYLRDHARERDFRIGLNYVITQENQGEIRQAARLAKGSGAHYIRFEPEFYSAYGHKTVEPAYREIFSALEDVSTLADEDFEVSIPKLDRGPMDQCETIEGEFTRCHYSRFVTAVGADGNLYPCPQVHLNSRYKIGNVVKEGYLEVLESGPRQQWEEQNPLRTDLCKTCFYRPQNELLEALLNGKLNVDEALSSYKLEVPESLHADFV